MYYSANSMTLYRLYFLTSPH